MHYTLRAGDVVVADNGYGYRGMVAVAVRQQADVVLRLTPSTFPLETEGAAPFEIPRGSVPGA